MPEITLKEALKILERWYEGGYATQMVNMTPAIKLGIEAIKVYEKSQEAGWYPPGYKLPGEIRE